MWAPACMYEGWADPTGKSPPSCCTDYGNLLQECVFIVFSMYVLLKYEFYMHVCMYVCMYVCIKYAIFMHVCVLCVCICTLYLCVIEHNERWVRK